MTTFDEREHAFEEKFVHDEEIRFRVHALRNRLLGEWAAKELHLRPDEAANYAMALAQADVAKFHDDKIVRKVVADFSAKGRKVSESEIRAKLVQLLPIAKRQIAGGA